jgi:hypothetical protein
MEKTLKPETKKTPALWLWARNRSEQMLVREERQNAWNSFFLRPYDVCVCR